MHEMALCRGVVQILEEQAKAQAYSRVKTVWLEIGPLTTVEPEALRFCFDVATRGTPAENAKLDIITTARPPGAFPAEKPSQYQSATASAPTAAAIKSR